MMVYARFNALSPRQSASHARIIREGLGARIEDLGSLNGTWVDGAIVNAAPLHDGSSVQIGTFTLIYHESTPERIETGGLAAMAERNWAKANLLYDLLEHSELFHGTTQADSRSIANVTFRTGDAELDAAFVAGAAEHQIQNVKGHRLVGGMRASVYNAVTMEDVQALASYMKDFETQRSLSPRSN